MEEELFSWGEWDELDTGIMQYHNITLKVPMGKYLIDTKFTYCVVDTQGGRLILGSSGGEIKFNLHFRVGDEFV